MIRQKPGTAIFLAIACFWMQTYSACSAIAANAELTHVVNVKSFGAKGDGVTDDQAALENAFQFASTAGNIELFFPPGRYLHSNLLTTTNTGIVGSAATLVATGDIDLKALSLVGKCHVSDMGVEFASSSLTQFEAAMRIGAGSGTVVTQCRFNNVATAISLLPTSSNAVVSKCTFTNPSNDATSTIVLQGSHQLVTKCSFVDNTGSSDAIQTGSISNGRITGNTFSNVAVAVFLNALFGGPANIVQIDLNTMQVRDSGVLGFGSNITINDNEIRPVAANGGSDGISATNSGNSFDNILIKSNVISGFGGSGINGQFSAANIQHNQISQCGGPGIDITETCNGLNITENVLRNCGLTTGPAVIYVEDGTSSIGIRNNRYSGNTNNLTYFIWSVPNATLSGNMTNTGLGNHIGP